MNEEKLRKIVDEASYAFWQVIAAQCPEIITGDFPPDAHFEMEVMNLKFVELWYKLNKNS